MRIPFTMYPLFALFCLAPTLSFAGEGRQQLDRQRSINDARDSLDTLKSRSDVLRVRARAFRPVVGIVLGAGNDSDVRIVAVTPQGAAGEAGVRSGDLLVSVDGKALAGASADERIVHARALLADLTADKSVTLGLTREGKAVSIPVKPRTSTTLSLVDNLQLMPEDVRHIVVHPRTSGALPSPDSTIDDAVRLDIIRNVGPGLCKGDDCTQGLLSEVLRWNNLNLIQLEPELGRYFGTDRGVLVLSAAALPGLKAGDVIQSIEGTPVSTPQEAMRALTSHKPGESANVRVLRERKEQALAIQVPERMAAHARFVPTRPMVLPADGVKQSLQRRHMIIMDANGDVKSIEESSEDAPPATQGSPNPPL